MLTPEDILLFKEIGRRLEDAGYREASKKPMLYFRATEKIIFYADLRIKDWHRDFADFPHFYFQKIDDIPDWLLNRFINEEISMLGIRYKVDVNLSGFEPPTYNNYNGICCFCGRDFQDDGDYCSEECKLAHEETYKSNCVVCGKDLDYNSVIKHHVNYNPEKIIDVCRSCHLKIHRSDKYPNLKPKVKRLVWYERIKNL